jgi:hypothetical protein
MKSRLRSSEVDVRQDKAGNLRNLASGQAIQGNGRKVPRLSRRTKLGRCCSYFLFHSMYTSFDALLTRRHRKRKCQETADDIYYRLARVSMMIIWRNAVGGTQLLKGGLTPRI